VCVFKVVDVCEKNENVFLEVMDSTQANLENLPVVSLMLTKGFAEAMSF